MEKLNDELYKLTDDGVLYYDLDEFHEREAKAIGRKEGLEQGRTEGLEQGKRIIVQNMYDSGMKLEDISKFSKMPLEEVKKIINEEK